MEIRVIPSRLQKHVTYFEDEVRMLYSIREMLDAADISDSNKSAVIKSIRRLNTSIKTRNEIFENLGEMLKNQEQRIKDHVDSLKESQRR